MDIAFQSSPLILKALRGLRTGAGGPAQQTRAANRALLKLFFSVIIITWSKGCDLNNVTDRH